MNGNPQSIHIYALKSSTTEIVLNIGSFFSDVYILVFLYLKILLLWYLFYVVRRYFRKSETLWLGIQFVAALLPGNKLPRNEILLWKEGTDKDMKEQILSNLCSKIDEN